jgi:hypothetical protein
MLVGEIRDDFFPFVIISHIKKSEKFSLEGMSTEEKGWRAPGESDNIWSRCIIMIFKTIFSACAVCYLSRDKIKNGKIFLRARLKML